MSRDLEKRAVIVSPSTPSKTQTSGPLYVLFVSNTISYIGDMLTLLAIPWFVLQTTGSVEQAGITGFCSSLPIVLTSFFASPFIDKIGYKRTSLISDTLSAITVLLVPLLYQTIGLPFWQLLLLVFIGGLVKTPAMTARGVMLPDLAQLAAMRLERVNAWNDGTRRVSSFLGAPLAGVLIAFIGTSNLLWLDAASFAISALLVGFCIPEVGIIANPKNEDGEQAGFLNKIRDGLHFLIHDRVLLSIVLVVMVTNLLDSANFAVVAPAYIMQTFHSAIPFGLLVATAGGMAFVGTLIFGLIGHHFPRRLTFGIGFIIGGALRFWILLIPIFPLLLGWYALGGLAIAPINALIMTVLQERTPQTMRARVLSSLDTGTMVGVPLGTFVSGFVVSWLGLRRTLFVMGAIYLLATLSILINPTMKQMDHER